MRREGGSSIVVEGELIIITISNGGLWIEPVRREVAGESSEPERHDAVEPDEGGELRNPRI